MKKSAEIGRRLGLIGRKRVGQKRGLFYEEQALSRESEPRRDVSLRNLTVPEPYIALVIPENSVKLGRDNLYVSRDLYTRTPFIPDIFWSGINSDPCNPQLFALQLLNLWEYISKDFAALVGCTGPQSFILSSSELSGSQDPKGRER